MSDSHWTDKPNPEFERWWATKTAAGYQYGREALENVRFGFEGAQERRWLPIETAPKDGTEVLLAWHWDSGTHRGVSVTMSSWYCRIHVHLSRAKHCPSEPDCKEGWGAYGGYISHWMPLPDPPSLEPAGKQLNLNERNE